jgi:Holliday junction resolvasome RuvABC endonuclease subunit
MEITQEGIIVSEQAKKDDQERRLKEFQEKYKKLVEEYQIDITAIVQPMMKFIDLKEKK